MAELRPKAQELKKRVLDAQKLPHLARMMMAERLLLDASNLFIAIAGEVDRLGAAAPVPEEGSLKNRSGDLYGK